MPGIKVRTIAEVGEVKWTFDPVENTHYITYGDSVKEFSGRDFGEVEAAHEFGECIAHEKA